MKYFFRTTGGKITLFLTALLSVCVVLGCLAGAILFWDYGFYEKSENAQFSDRIMYNAVSDWLNMYNYGRYEEEEVDGVRIYKSEGNLVLNVTDSDGNLIARTPEAETEDLNFRYVIELRDINGSEDRPIWDVAMITGDTSFRIYSVYYVNLGSNASKEQILNVSFLKGFPKTDRYMFMHKVISLGYRLRYAVYGIGVFFGLLALVAFIMLMCVSGRQPGDEKVHRGLLGGMPFDVMTAGVVFIIVIYLAMVDAFFLNGVEETIVVIVLFPLMLALFMGYCMSFATRLKEHSIVRKSAIMFILRAVWKGIKGIPTAWRALIFLTVDFFVNLGLLAVATEEPAAAVFFLAVKSLFVLGLAIYFAARGKVLEKGAEAISRGNLEYQVDTSGMMSGMRRTGEYLNTIAKGMSIAVEQRTKSERMKTELITNVSHDIKTPLTSIINYAGLIAKEHCDNEKHAEYCEVLTRQSEKLKRLIENLVEASKAATGNLEVHLAPCDAGVFLTQASGEYDDKLAEANLTLVVKQPEENLRIMADGRHMWRVFDNLMNNICKYSVPGTRVYLTLERDHNMAQFLFKNTSKEILDISEEELMERFVRGDSSRNTEGNGLGLSIAKSLAQLQKGWLRIETDGDLFKAILRFPLVEDTPAELLSAPGQEPAEEPAEITDRYSAVRQ
ncbi:MAG: HAMP domain-containing histidine kinase [Lachnospiraceae bacterium]|nr:HAMP domain-containing histidine kinase [Lachnospiraceae bacterium]